MVLSDDKAKPIVKIGGDLEKSKIHAELFHFLDHRYYVLRIWCYWITDEFYKGTSLINQFVGEDEEYIDGRSTDVGWVKKGLIEIPDIERFDLIINKVTSKG